jgi:sphingomyelin phosphodiesterase
MQATRTFQDINHILVTGDFPPHNIWSQSGDDNINHAEAIIDTIKEVFPKTPVFPSLGNHEPHPANK